MTDERTDGGKWKIVQCSVGPETAKKSKNNVAGARFILNFRWVNCHKMALSNFENNEVIRHFFMISAQSSPPSTLLVDQITETRAVEYI